MTVRKHSWHYRLWMLGRKHTSQPRDLCRYFWHLVLIKILAPTTLALLALTGIGALLWLIWGHPGVTAMVVAAAAALVAFVVGAVWLIGKLIDRHRDKVSEREFLAQTAPPAPPKPKKPPNPFWAYLKARKRKVCPLITVVDE